MPAPPRAKALADVPKPEVSFASALSLVRRGDAARAFDMAWDLPNALERRTAQWAAIQYGGSKLGYKEIAAFEAEAPHFASASLFKTRKEQALAKQDLSSKEIIARLGGAMPNTIAAQIDLAAAYIADGQKARAGRIARVIWIDNYLDRELEAEVLDKLGSVLSNKDHWDRAVHLLMHDRATGTERIMDRLTPAQKSLAAARIAVARKKPEAQDLLDKVDPSLRNHPLFHFAQAQLAHDRGDLSAALDALDAQKSANVPDGALFWYERQQIARQALAKHDYKLAYRAAAGFTDGPEGRVVEAQFHAGWIALEFLHEPARAAGHFKEMAALSTLPDSISQSNYWWAQALKAQGKTDEAQAKYAEAAKHSTQFYGQLARETLGQPLVTLRSLPPWRDREPVFDDMELVRAVRLLAKAGQPKMAEPLVRTLAYSFKDGPDLLLTARLAQEIGAHQIAILTADIADRRGVALDLFNYPRDGLPPHADLAAIDNAAIYAIARQESRFQVDAVSGAGARGIMQLMPGTARETAGRIGLAYSAEKLVRDAEYNALLGSTYLGYQLDRYDGSLLLAAAAYNAGAGNVNKWIDLYGDPRDAKVDPVNWIELIPFEETRTYVQRVLANYTVYRVRLGHPEARLAEALRRIPD